MGQKGRSNSDAMEPIWAMGAEVGNCVMPSVMATYAFNWMATGKILGPFDNDRPLPPEALLEEA